MADGMHRLWVIFAALIFAGPAFAADDYAEDVAPDRIEEAKRRVAAVKLVLEALPATFPMKKEMGAIVDELVQRGGLQAGWKITKAPRTYMDIEPRMVVSQKE